MAKLTIDLTGAGGLLERHQGDLNDTTAKPYLRYLGQDDGYADGIFNPFKLYGYMSPAVSTYTTLTGTIAAPINQIVYNPKDDEVYFSEQGENILYLDGLNDTSLANYLTVTNSGDTIKDMELYEINGARALFYLMDSGDTAYSIDGATLSSSVPDEYFGGLGGQYVGFKILDTGVDDRAIEVTEDNIYGGSLFTNYPTAAIDDGTNYSTKLAQPFSTDLMISKKVQDIGLRLIRSGGTGTGITIKVSIQSEADRNAGDYTYIGAWNSGTAYSVNDTVEKSSITFVCIQAHTNKEPEVAGDSEEYWQRFGAPSGTEIASATVSATEIPDNTVNITGFSWNTDTNLASIEKTWFEFSSDATLDPNTIYWIVLEESGSNMVSTDIINWTSTTNDDATYDTGTVGDCAKHYGPNPISVGSANQWHNNNVNDGAQKESRDFEFGWRRFDYWSRDMAAGHFIVQPGENGWLHRSDDGYLYWVQDRTLHRLDGRSTGGPTGRTNPNILTFPEHITISDIGETRGQMYFGIQTADYTTTTQDRTFPSASAGVVIWNRRALVVGSTDYYNAPGAREIKSVFPFATGDVRIITTNDAGFCEIRQLSGNQYEVVQTFEKDGFPVNRKGIKNLAGMAVWTGLNGIHYAYGRAHPQGPIRLYKIGDISDEANSGFIPGPLFVGHEESTEPRQGIFQAWQDGDPSYIVQKWYPNGDGTIDSIAQKANAGNVYSKVFLFGGKVKINYAQLFLRPTTSSGSTQIATVKVYFNQSSTASHTFNITQKDASDGFMYLPIGKRNTPHAIQVEVEFDETQTLGDDDFNPAFLELDYDFVDKKK